MGTPQVPSDVPSFDSFAEEGGYKPRLPCGFCVLPDDVKAECAKAWEKGFRGSVISQYLVTLGYNIGLGTVENHFKRRHK